ncbi:MAG: hypothetical protein ACKVOJ_09630 [Sphingomonadaceae bacterium]
MFQPFSDEQARVVVNLDQAYDVWMSTFRTLNDMPYNMRIKEVSGREYLYEVTDRRGTMKSKGALDPAKQNEFDKYKADKVELKDRLVGARETLKEQASLYRALRLPMLSAEAGKILREADRLKFLGEQAMVVGTNALVAYATPKRRLALARLLSTASTNRCASSRFGNDKVLPCPRVTDKPNSSCSQAARSTIRHGTTPCDAGIGPASTMAASALRWLSSSIDTLPGLCA